MKLRTKTKSSVEKLSLEFEFDTRKEFDIFCCMLDNLHTAYQTQQKSIFESRYHSRRELISTPDKAEWEMFYKVRDEFREQLKGCI